jgi:uncharacterized damage-inducible protein DinB
MPLNQGLLPEFDIEMENTRKVLERVPVEKGTWKPHPKSPTMTWLSSHVAQLPVWAEITVNTDSLDLEVPFDRPQEPTTTAELVAAFEKNRNAARAAIVGASDDQLMQAWTLKKGAHTLFTMPRIAVLRSFVMNHMIHHRAQLTIYLRLNDVPVPGLYGPSADEI